MKCVLYARYSSENQTENSIEGQLRECSEFAERKGYKVIKTYADRAISGKKADNRPQFMQMITDSKQKNFDAVIVWKIDRFSRDKYDSVYYKNVLKKNGVSVISATEPIDDSPEGQLMESIFEGFSVYYIEDLSMKVSRGMTENTLKGKFNGGGITFGYIIDENKHFQPDPVNAPIVTEIFARYASGESIKDILAMLKEKGIKTNRGRTPEYSFIANLLKNRRYLGEYSFKDTVVENAFTPLVDTAIFEKCQRRLAENQHKPAHFKVVEDKYILTGKIFCGHCGGTMSGVSGTSKTGKIHRYYYCHAAKKKSCDKKRVTKDFVESTVINHIMNMFKDKPLINQIVEGCYEFQTKQNVNLPVLEQQLTQTEKEIENVMNAIKQGIITATTKETLVKLEQDKENLEINIAKERIERPVLSKEQIKFWICKFGKTDIENIEEKQRLIDVFLNSVYVYDDKMLIILNYKDGEICVDFGEVNDKLNASKTENPDNFNSYQGSPLLAIGEPPGNRTPDHMIKSHVLYRLS